MTTGAPVDQAGTRTQWRMSGRKAAIIATIVLCVAATAAVIYAVAAVDDQTMLPTGATDTFVGVVLLGAIGLVLVCWILAARSAWITAAASVSGAVGGAMWLNSEFGTLHGVTWAVCTTAIVMFAVVLVTAGGASPTKTTMRNAITASVVSTYLVSVGLVLFFHDSRATLPEITSTMVQNFTVVTGVVIGFYFGGASVEKVAEIRAVGSGQQDPAEIAAVAER